MYFLKYLNNRKGETIAETLVATLIAALSMVMFAGMVMASKTIVDASNKKIIEYYDGFSQLISKEEVTETSLKPITIYTNKNGVVYYEYSNTDNSDESEESGETSD